MPPTHPKRRSHASARRPSRSAPSRTSCGVGHAGAALLRPVPPARARHDLGLALYTTIPIIAFALWRGWPFYPGAAFRLLVVRPFWYTQLLLPLVSGGGALGLILGAPFGAVARGRPHARRHDARVRRDRAACSAISARAGSSCAASTSRCRDSADGVRRAAHRAALRSARRAAHHRAASSSAS